MLVKAIFRANLQFGNPRSFEQAVKTYHHKVEQLYKGEVCIKPEVVFDEATFSMSVPNLVIMAFEKTVKNTAFLIENLAQYASSGKCYCWILDNGRATFSYYVEPMEGKIAVQHFIKGRQYAKEAGHEELAIQELSAAINKFERHWTAFERRGYIQGLLGNWEQAIADFDSSIAINEHQADAYFSRARINMSQGTYEKAIADFDVAWKNANPQLPIYWSARRMKAESCLKLGNFADAAQELKFFTNQTFAEDNPNFPWMKSAWLNYSYALKQNKQDAAAKDAFLKAYKVKDSIEPIIEGDLLKFCEQMSKLYGIKIPAEETKGVLAL